MTRRVAVAAAWLVCGALAAPALTAEIDHPAADTDKTRKRARKVIEKALAAQGGREALAEIRDLRLTGQERKAQNPDAPWQLEVLWRAPGMYLETLRRSDPRPLEVSYGWDGQDGWASGFGQLQPDPASAARLREFDWTRIEHIDARVQAGALTLLEWGKLEEDGRKWQVLEATTADRRERRYLLFEREGGRLARVRHDSGRIAGLGRETTTLELSDWREVAIPTPAGPGGEAAPGRVVWWPHGFRERTRSRALETTVRERQFERVEVNVGLAPGRFTRGAAR